MTALLLTWTQRGWPYDDVRRMVRDFKSGELVEPWRIQAFRQAFDGQRAFCCGKAETTEFSVSAPWLGNPTAIQPSRPERGR